jgi:DnaJ-class molecular chaperone
MAGKGSKPRSCFSQEFKKNFDEINWNYDKKCPMCDGKGFIQEDIMECPACKGKKHLTKGKT